MAGEILAQLPEDLRTNEAFTGMNTAGDMAKAYLDMKGKYSESDGKIKEFEGKVNDLTGKLTNSIPKLGEKATPEEVKAFYTALGKPEKSTDYEFPKTDGVDHDPKMVEWAQKTFHDAHLSKEQAKAISTAWDGFITGMAQAEKDARENARKEAETALKTELGDKYNEAIELTKRMIKKHAGEADFKFFDETGMGNHPGMIRLVLKFAKLTGEDKSPPGTPGGTAPVQPGMNYNMPKFA